MRAEQQQQPTAAIGAEGGHSTLSAQTSPRAAVCLTGLERSFREIGGNVKEGLYHLLPADTEIFGVRPNSAFTITNVSSSIPLSSRSFSSAGSAMSRSGAS